MYSCETEHFLCKDPGALTCRGDLNDCNGNGDCVHGACRCYLGWGGPACDVPVCRTSCDDVRPGIWQQPAASHADRALRCMK